MVEVSKRHPPIEKADILLLIKQSNRLNLREMSQVHPDDKIQALDENIHSYFNTNNIWIRISALKKSSKIQGGSSPPVIRNNKNVDPTNPSSAHIVQLETAMGAAISLFENSTCIEVDRSRFLPVKRLRIFLFYDLTASI